MKDWKTMREEMMSTDPSGTGKAGFHLRQTTKVLLQVMTRVLVKRKRKSMLTVDMVLVGDG